MLDIRACFSNRLPENVLAELEELQLQITPLRLRFELEADFDPTEDSGESFICFIVFDSESEYVLGEDDEDWVQGSWELHYGEDNPTHKPLLTLIWINQVMIDSRDRAQRAHGLPSIINELYILHNNNQPDDDTTVPIPAKYEMGDDDDDEEESRPMPFIVQRVLTNSLLHTTGSQMDKFLCAAHRELENKYEERVDFREYVYIPTQTGIVVIANFEIKY